MHGADGLRTAYVMRSARGEQRRRGGTAPGEPWLAVGGYRRAAAASTVTALNAPAGPTPAIGDDATHMALVAPRMGSSS